MHELQKKAAEEFERLRLALSATFGKGVSVKTAHKLPAVIYRLDNPRMKNVAITCEKAHLPNAERWERITKNSRTRHYVAEIRVENTAVYFVFYAHMPIKCVIEELQTINPFCDVEVAVYESVAYARWSPFFLDILRFSVAQGISPTILKLLAKW